ncbi:MAG: VCBS repeat-containing protein [Bacteroidota bacterium]
MKTKILSSVILTLILVGLACKEQKKPAVENDAPAAKVLAFEQTTIADSVMLLWATDPVELTGDGIADLLFIDNNGYGGKLGYYRGQTENGLWKKTLINIPEELAMGDLEAADMDNDGDIDIVAAHHNGEWEGANEPSTIYWYENPSWEAHPIGEAPNFIKDMSIADFNKDGKMDVATLCFEVSSLRIFQQNGADDWTMVQEYKNYGNLHEGMDVGDVNGDGFPDIVAGGHLFQSPGEDLNVDWSTENIDEKWNNQTGDWSRNGTKTFLRDLDNDGQSEVFVSHSERAGFPLSYYKKTEGTWKEYIISDSIPACHTLQVFDFDLDGDFDVLAGVNKSRAQGLEYETFPITLFLSNKNHTKWEPMVISEEGIYNGQAIDYDGDGDMDIFRYQTHDAVTYQLLENTIND